MQTSQPATQQMAPARQSSSQLLPSPTLVWHSSPIQEWLAGQTLQNVQCSYQCLGAQAVHAPQGGRGLVPPGATASVLDQDTHPGGLASLFALSAGRAHAAAGQAEGRRSADGGEVISIIFMALDPLGRHCMAYTRAQTSRHNMYLVAGRAQQAALYAPSQLPLSCRQYCVCLHPLLLSLLNCSADSLTCPWSAAAAPALWVCHAPVPLPCAHDSSINNLLPAGSPCAHGAVQRLWSGRLSKG